MITEIEMKRLQQELADEVLMYSRNALIFALRFMDTALGRFRLIPKAGVRYLATNGETLFYSPKAILETYKKEQTSISRDYLHVCLHCVFHHPFDSSGMDVELWDLACDIAVENSINELALEITNCVRQDMQKKHIAALDLTALTAEKIYRNFRNNTPSDDEIIEMRGVFHVDDHRLWYDKPQSLGKIVDMDDEDEDYFEDEEEDEEENQRGKKVDNENIDDSGADEPEQEDEDGEIRERITIEHYVNDYSESEDEKEDSEPEGGGDNQGEDDGGGGGGGDGSGASEGGEGDGEESSEADSETDPETTSFETASSEQELEELWNDISERVEVDLKTFSRDQGDSTGSIMQNLRAVNREEYDYTQFLRKFAVVGEQLKINIDEFDYIYYTYGMKLTGKIPLIEPLEYKEEKMVREFVIAIDTSGSVSGELVQQFVQKTYNILKQSESFFTRVNIHIIQCDTKIQEDYVISSQEDFDEYIANMQLLGFGGTDFRPVFSYVDELVSQKVFSDLRGLIYFTDGLGEFPEYVPDYETAFVFVEEDEGEIPAIPPWAIKLVLRPDEI